MLMYDLFIILTYNHEGCLLLIRHANEVIGPL